MRERGVIAYRGKGNIYLNLTNRCMCACTFCLREFADGAYGYTLVLGHEPDTGEIVRALEREFLDGPADQVVFCGLGEPTLRLSEVLQVTEWLRLRRIVSRLDTNGLARLANPDVDVVPSLVAAGLGSVSISLNAPDPNTYERLCRPIYSKAFREVLAFTSQCIAAGLRSTLTVVDHPEVDVDACAALAQRLGAAFAVRGLVTPNGAPPTGRLGAAPGVAAREVRS